MPGRGWGEVTTPVPPKLNHMEIPSGPEDVANFVFTTEVRPWRKHLKEYAR